MARFHKTVAGGVWPAGKCMRPAVADHADVSDLQAGSWYEPEFLARGTNPSFQGLRETRPASQMSDELHEVGDRSRAPDGVGCSLTTEDALDPSSGDTRLDSVAQTGISPVVEEVLLFADLPLGSLGTCSAVVRWSDGTSA
jgi:hypothetical protein